MKTHSSSLWRVGACVVGLALPAGPALALGLDYRFTGNFVAGSFLDATLIDGLDFEVHIATDTTIPDNDPGDADRGEFLGPYSARITIEGMGTYQFVNPVASIVEWVDSPGFQPVETRATFAGGSTSSMTGFSPDTITPFFGDPNLLDPFPGGANVVVADFNAEPLMLLGGGPVLSLSGQSPGGTVSATTIPDAGSSLALFGAAAAGLMLWRGRARPLAAAG